MNIVGPSVVNHLPNDWYNNRQNISNRSEVNGFLIYQDCSALGRSTDADAGKAFVIPVDADSKGNVFSGIYHKDVHWIDDVHNASILETSSIDDCILKVTNLLCCWTIEIF